MEQSRDKAIDKYNYQVEAIDSSTWVLTDYFGGHSYLLEGEESALLTDTGTGVGDLWETISKLTDKKVILVNTHGHVDHIGYNHLFDEFYLHSADQKLYEKHSSQEFRASDLPGYVHEMCPDFDEEVLQKMLDAKRNLNFRKLAGGEVFRLGCRELQVIHTPGHTKGSICIWDEERRYLFSGDTICDIGILIMGEEADSVSQFYQSVKKLAVRIPEDVKLYPGHHTIGLGKEYIKQYEICAKLILQGELVGYRHISSVGEGFQADHERVGIRYQEV